MNKKRTAHHLFLCSSLCACLLLLTSCSKTPNSNPDTPSMDQAPQKQDDIWGAFDDQPALSFIQNCAASYERASSLFKSIEHAEHLETTALLSKLNDLESIINDTMAKASLYANVHPNEEMRNAAEKCEQNFVGLVSDISLSQPLYTHVETINIDELESRIDKRYVEHTLRDFRRSGVNLDSSSREKVKQLTDEINELGQAFYKNIREDVRTVTLASDADVSGMPEDYITSHRDAKTSEIHITTNYPDYFPVMQYADSDQLKHDLYIQFKQRGYPSNHEVLNALIEKRHELANTLGYKNYATYVTEEQMITSPAKVQEFIDSIDRVALPQATREYAELLHQLQSIDPTATAVQDWQKTYLSEIIKKQKYDVDSQEVREYLQYDKVKQGIFDLTETLFNVQIRPWDTPTWHESVQAFELIDNNKVIGQFYLDMHPRSGKYQHAAAFSVQDGILGKQLPIKALVCNFPTGDDLMEHAQVETFLHEFGHLLHGLFGGHQKWVAQSGIKTEWDFVEAPSQMLEEWIWNSETLKTFATNKKGEAIPESLISKLRDSRDFGLGLNTRHQMFYASLSLNAYNQAPNSFNLHDTAKLLQEQYSNFSYVNDTYFEYSFGHLYGYSAVYYSYMWSLVIADDMFSEFEKNGLLDPKVAARYRKYVLEPGGTEDAATLVEQFLGRPYTFDAFAKKFH